MKTVFVGGGAGCKAVLQMTLQQRLATLSLEIIGVMDLDSNAPAMRFARDHGWPTFTNLKQALSLPELEMVIELTGDDTVRDSIFKLIPQRVRLMDHYMARVFWDLDAVAQDLRDELTVKTKLESESRIDKLRLQELLDSLPDMVMVVDEDGTIQRVNRQFEEAIGRTASEIVGHPCFQSEDTDEPRPVCRDSLCPRLAVLESGQPLSLVRQKNCFDWGGGNSDAYYEVTATPNYNSKGGVSVVITSREVTELVHLKRETEQAARRSDQIIATVHGLITITDLDGHFEVVNPAAARFWNLSPDEMLGKTAAQLFPVDIARLFEQHDEELLAKGERTNHEFQFVFGGNEHIFISERILLTDYRGKPAGICCVARDITKPRRLQRELILSEKHAAVGKLAAGVAHEINNPLTGILTFSEELLEDTAEQDPAREDLEVIVRETLRCRQIVRDLLDYSRHATLNRQVVDIKPVIERSLSLVKHQAAFHDIVVVRDLAKRPLNVRADPNQLEQVFLNLIINARDSMDGKGEIVLRGFDVPNLGRVVVEVEDSGVGIEKEELKSIFEPFFSTKGDQGNGLGLTAVHGIIEQHDGDIEVESEVGQGSLFRISLPAVRSSTTEQDGQQEERT